MKKIKSKIINCSLNEFTNKETGEVTQMTKVTYIHPKEDTESFVGPATLECYKVGNYLNLIKDKTIDKYDRTVELELEEEFTKNGIKFRLISIDNKRLD